MNRFITIIMFSCFFSSAQVVGTPYFFTPDNRPILDKVPGAGLAYSSRKLISSYSGFAMRVRRSSDQATSDIGFDSNGDLNTTDLLTFVGTASAYVTIWYDQSGNGKDLTQTTIANQPRIVVSGVLDKENNRPFIRFYGTLNSSTIFNSLNLASDFTTTAQVIIVNKFISTDGFLLSHTSSIFNWHSAPTTKLFTTYTSSSVFNGTMFQNGVSKTGSTMPWNTTLSINSVAPVTPATGTTWNNIGRDRTFHHITGGGGYGEIIVFSTAISDSQRQLIEKDQGAYFSITVN